MEIYLDNSSTTKPYKEVCEKISDVMFNNFGNPSSLHRIGISAEKEIKLAKEMIAKTLGSRPDEIYFTSGGTESDNIAIMGGAFSSRQKRILSTPIEHPAVLNTLSHLESLGYTIDYIPLDSEGRVILSEFEDMLSCDCALITAMLTNNETGVIQPIEKMVKIAKNRCPSALFHTDAVQGYCKVPCNVRALGVDMISISGHKIHGPKGMGILYIKKGVPVSPIIFGGGQQSGLRPGTENVAGIAGIALAAHICHSRMNDSVPRMSLLLEKLENGLTKNLENIRINTPKERAPHILNVSFGGVRSEVLLHSLEAEGIYVSSGSACSSHKSEPSYVLTQMGVDKKMIDGSIRFSLCEYTTPEDIEKTITAVCDAVMRLRRLNIN